MKQNHKSGFSSFGLGIFAQPVSGFDSAAGQAASELESNVSDIDVRSLLSDVQTMRGLALLIVLNLVDAVTDNTIPEDTIPSEYLDELMLEALGLEDDDELDPLVNQLLTANIGDALGTLGVADDVIADIFGDDVEAADAAIEAASETVIANMPEAGDELSQFYQGFVYGFDADDVLNTDEDEAVQDEFDAAGKTKKKLSVGRNSVREVHGRKIRYKAIKVVRHGKITVINKRLAGQRIKLSAKQKAGLKRLNVKSHTYGAINRRMRSLAKGIKANIYKGARAKHAASAVKAANTGLNRHFGDS